MIDKDETQYKIIPWTTDIDLTKYYSMAYDRGFFNNSSQKNMIDCFKNERESQTWIMFYKDKPAGSVACHTLDIMGPTAYRILARCCVMVGVTGQKGMSTINLGIRQHQSFTDQVFMPACIEWAGRDKDLYVTTNDLPIATQRLSHRIWAPTHAESGILENVGEKEYRGTIQTFWKLDVERFYNSLNKFPRWNIYAEVPVSKLIQPLF